MTSFNRLGIVADHVNRHPAMRQVVLNAYPDAKFHDAGHRLDEDELINFLSDCDAAIIGFEPVTERVLSALPQLKIISKYGNGCESFDFAAMKRHNIRFGYTWGVNKLAVAELALGFMLMGLRWVPPLNVAMREGKRPALRNGRFLTGRVVGIHGCGNIGKEVTRLLKPFNCTILACDIKDYPEFYKEWNVTPVSHEELLARSEIITLHLPKTKQTLGLYSREVLAKMRSDCSPHQHLSRRYRGRGGAARALGSGRTAGGVLRCVCCRAGAERPSAAASQYACDPSYRRLDRGDAAYPGARRYLPPG